MTTKLPFPSENAVAAVAVDDPGSRYAPGSVNWVSQDTRHPSVAAESKSGAAVALAFLLTLRAVLHQRNPALYRQQFERLGELESALMAWRRVAGADVGEAWSVTDRVADELLSSASIAGGGEAGAEKRSVLEDRARHADVTARTLGRLAVDIQARRIATLEAVARVARAALERARDRFVDLGVGASLGVLAPVDEAVRELAATLPDEREAGEGEYFCTECPWRGKTSTTCPACNATAVKPKARTTPSTLLEIRTAGESKVVTTTVREFFDVNEDEWLRDAVRSLRPGDSVSVGGGAAPMFTVTRKAA